MMRETWMQWVSHDLPFGCFRAWANLPGHEGPTFTVKFIDSVCEGMGDAMAWNGLLPYFESIGLSLKPAAYRDEWPESRLCY